jgi:uncharacterized protein (UPF0276 family)
MTMQRPPSPAAVRERGPLSASAGIGLRFPHHRLVAETRPSIGWLEVHSENYMGGGTPVRQLEAIRAHYPISLHGVGLSLGTAGVTDARHLRRVNELVERVQPALVSEHLSWSVTDGTYLADLLPLPMTEEALDVVCRHVDEVQTALNRQILVENPSSYLRYRHSTIPEWEFLSAVSARTGCGILCDVNNIYVSCCNHGWDAQTYLAALPANAISEIHIAGHSAKQLPDGRIIRIDDHSTRVSADVWQLYSEALELFGPVPSLVEWDTNIPGLDVLLDEAAIAQRALGSAKEAIHANAA